MSARRGRLKLYVGFAAGVGKTWRMLDEAHALRSRGVDVMLGFIETHGRPDTAARLGELPVVPRRRLEYRGVTVEEMDLEAILARHPAVVVVDELPHTNAPDSKNRKRYQDVEQLLDAGIDVIAAIDIQHLEGLSDLVERETGVVVRETVPDRFVAEADQVVSIDLTVDELEERMRAGKIYPPDKVTWAQDHLFKPGNLATLRELALREVAESLERSAESARKRAEVPAQTGARLMVCMSSLSPAGPHLLRRGSRMAGRLNTDWFAVYVETPDEAPDRIDAAAQRHLHANIELARELGAEVIRLRGKDPVVALVDFARVHNVGTLIVGRSRQARWRQVLGRSVTTRLVREAAGLDLYIVALDRPEAT